MTDLLIKANEEAWDAKTPFHVSSRFYDVPGFLGGGSTLKGLERLLCSDVRGLDLLHLQCHFGLDTLSWARLGARVTGVDLSGNAIKAAHEIARLTSLNGTFVKADVQRLPDTFVDRFDLVVVTYGALCWLSDLQAWASGIARALRPGGRLVLVEFHPIIDVFYAGVISKRDVYFGDVAAELRTLGTYADRDADLHLTEYVWQHPTSDVISAIMGARLRLEHFEEYPFCSYQIVPDLDIERDGYWFSSAAPKRLPFLYSIVATK
jgi:SAM-dependent methyltransferase